MTCDRRDTTDTYLRTRIGHGIKKARTARGLTQTQVADQISVTQGQIAKYEAAADLPSVAILIKMAAKLDVSLDVLTGHTEPIEVPTVIFKYDRPGQRGFVHDRDQIKLPVISLERAASWRGLPLGGKSIQSYVYAPLFHLKQRMAHRLACIRTKYAIPPLVAADAIMCLDYSDVPAKGVNGEDRGLFLVLDDKKIRICRVVLSNNNVILSDDPIRSIDLRRKKNPLLARIVWLCQGIPLA